jgi:hypothetical protein
MYQRTHFITIISAASMLLTQCIGTDFIEDTIEERIIILSEIDELQVGESYQLMASFWDNTGILQEVPIVWDSSDPSVIDVDENGLITANQEGMVTISAMSNGVVQELMLKAGETTSVMETVSERVGELKSASSYPLDGDVTLIDLGNGNLRLEVKDNFNTTSVLPGLFVYLSNNPNTINDAFEIGEVTQFKGAHIYNINSVGLNDFNYVLFYCKPFVVRVGDAELD